MNRILLILIGLLLVNSLCFSQTKQDQAKILYFAAEEAYNIENYSECIDKLNEIETLLENTNSKVLELKIKAHFNNQDYVDAYIAKAKFFETTTNTYPGYDNILRITTKIDDNAKPLLEQEGIAAFENKDYEKAKYCLKSIHKQNPNNTEIEFYLLRSKYELDRNGTEADKIKQRLVVLEEQKLKEEENAYNLALNNSSIKYCDDYLNKYPDGSYYNAVLKRKSDIEYNDLFEKAKKEKGIENCNKYLNKYEVTGKKEDVELIKSIINGIINKIDNDYIIPLSFKEIKAMEGTWNSEGYFSRKETDLINDKIILSGEKESRVCKYFGITLREDRASMRYCNYNGVRTFKYKKDNFYIYEHNMIKGIKVKNYLYFFKDSNGNIAVKMVITDRRTNKKLNQDTLIEETTFLLLK